MKSNLSLKIYSPHCPFFVGGVQANWAAISIATKTSEKATLESLLSGTSSTNQDWTTSLWYWRHLDGKITVGSRKRVHRLWSSYVLRVFKKRDDWQVCHQHIYKHTCYVFPPQARIWVRRADWTSVFPLWEKIKSILRDKLALWPLYLLKPQFMLCLFGQFKCCKPGFVSTVKHLINHLSGFSLWINVFQV